MIFSLGKIVSYLSHLYPLSAGDIIATGSPEGSGGSLEPPKFLRSGDTVCVKVTSLGTLINKVN
jgi:2-keto-4-pentenoate hydratase/2-oxohepta-3-ene-1,7-dioic acid hydratase in catechol pathway